MGLPRRVCYLSLNVTFRETLSRFRPCCVHALAMNQRTSGPPCLPLNRLQQLQVSWMFGAFNGAASILATPNLPWGAETHFRRLRTPDCRKRTGRLTSKCLVLIEHSEVPPALPNYVREVNATNFELSTSVRMQVFDLCLKSQSNQWLPFG